MIGPLATIARPPQVWTGREVRLLREARRMSVRQFGAHLGVSDRMVSKWESGGHRIRPRPVNQAALDTSLEQASAEAKHRYQLALSQSGLAVPPVVLPDGACHVIRHPIDGKLMTKVEAGPHGVTRAWLPAFFIDVEPVTIREFARFQRITGRPSSAQPAPPSGSDGPVTGVGWSEVVAYSHWASKEPTNAENWARASSGSEGMTTSHVAEWCHIDGRPIECGPRAGANRGFRCVTSVTTILGLASI